MPLKSKVNKIGTVSDLIRVCFDLTSGKPEEKLDDDTDNFCKVSFGSDFRFTATARTDSVESVRSVEPEGSDLGIDCFLDVTAFLGSRCRSSTSFSSKVSGASGLR